MGSGAGHLTSAQLLVLERKSGWRPEDAGGIANEGRSITVQPRSPRQAGWMGAVCATHTHVRVHTFMPMYTCADRHTQIHRHTLTQVYTDLQMQTCTQTRKYPHSHTNMFTHRGTCTFAHRHTLTQMHARHTSRTHITVCIWVGFPMKYKQNVNFSS